MAKLVVARLGRVEFSVPEGTFSEMDRSTRYRVDVPDPIEGLGKPVVRGTAYDELTLRGVVFPGYSGTLNSVQRLRDLAEEGKSHLLVDGEGTLYGNWVITAVNERKSSFLATGVTRRAEWDVSLTADPDDVVLPL